MNYRSGSLISLGKHGVLVYSDNRYYVNFRCLAGGFHKVLGTGGPNDFEAGTVGIHKDSLDSYMH